MNFTRRIFLNALIATAASVYAPFTGAEPDRDKYMRRAIQQVQLQPRYPYGAVIVDLRSGEVLAEGHNQSPLDPTFHGEMVAIHAAAVLRPKIVWSQTALYTTAEPCPMCQAAVEWAGIAEVYYGTSIPFLTKLGEAQIEMRASEVAAHTPFRKTKVVGGVLEAECNALFQKAHKLRRST